MRETHLPPGAVLDDVLRAAGLPSGGTVIQSTVARVNDVYFIEDRFVVRIARHAADNERLERETGLLLDLSKAMPLVPKVVHAGVAADRFFQVQSRIAGQRLTHSWAELEGRQRSALVGELTDWLGALHARDVDAYGYGSETAAGWLSFILGELAALMENDRYPDTPRLREIEAATRRICVPFEAMEEGLWRPARLHFDLLPDNLLVRDGRLSGVVDFEMSLAGPRHAEFHKLHLVCQYPERIGAPPALASFLDEVRSRNKALLEDEGADEMFPLYSLYLIWRMLAHSAATTGFAETEEFAWRWVREHMAPDAADGR